MRFNLKTFFSTTVIALSLSCSACAADLFGDGLAPENIHGGGGRSVNAGEVGRDKLLGGKWMEIARTDVPSERGCSNVTIEFSVGVEGGLEFIAQGWDNGAGVWRRIEFVADKSVKVSRWRFWVKPSKVPVETLRCIKGSDADGWIAIVGSDGVRVLSRAAGMTWGGWERCCAALRAAGQPVGGLIYFF